jgi:hypothetical protein
MNDRFDQLAKGVAESETRRQAIKRFVMGLAALALPGFALSSKSTSHCLQSGSPCGRPGQGGCGSCCSKSFFCQISADTGKQCFCN